MKNIDIIRAWKDESYRNSLTAEELSQLPANPAGNLSVEEQQFVAGGAMNLRTRTRRCSACGTFCSEE